jgi:hypothetical protein
MANPTLTMAYEEPPQDFTLRRGDTKQCMAAQSVDPVCNPFSNID